MSLQPQPPKRDRRDQFLYWWPVTARVAGLAIAGVELAAKVEKPGVLAFAGALIVAPNIFDQQRKRNDRRLEEE